MLCDKSFVEGLGFEILLGMGDKRVDYDEGSFRLIVDFLLVLDSLYLGSVNVESELEDVDFKDIEIEF